MRVLLFRTGLIWALAAFAAAGPFLFSGPARNNAPGATPEETFTTGEMLVYKVEWSPPWYLFFLPTMDAGEATLGVFDGTETEDGKETVRIVFTARSSGAFAKLAGVTVEDHFESHADADTLCTISVQKKIREGKRKRDIDVRFEPDRRRLHIRAVNVAAVPPKVDRDEYVNDIPPCVRDIFAALFEVRRRDFAEGVRHRSLVGDDDLVREIETQVEKKEMVKTPHGRYETWKVNTVSLFGGLFKDGGQFRVWLTADSQKMPVKFEAKVRLGKVTGELTALKRTTEEERDRSQP